MKIILSKHVRLNIISVSMQSVGGIPQLFRIIYEMLYISSFAKSIFMKGS